MSKEVVVVTVKMPKELVEALDKLVEYGIFESRSEAVRTAVKMLLSAMPKILSMCDIKLSEEELKKYIVVTKKVRVSMMSKIAKLVAHRYGVALTNKDIVKILELAIKLDILTPNVSFKRLVEAYLHLQYNVPLSRFRAHQVVSKYVQKIKKLMGESSGGSA